MPIKKLKKRPLKKATSAAKSAGRSESQSEASPLNRIRTMIEDYKALKEKNNDANNAVNRKKTAIKNELHTYLTEIGATVNDGVVIDGEEIAHRPNVSENIDPQVWFEWYQAKKISRNQFFKAISVSVTEARNAIGNDQIGQITHETLSKTPDLRIIPAVDEAGRPFGLGTIRPFIGRNVKTAKDAKQVETDQTGKAVVKAPVKRRRKVTL